MNKIYGAIEIVLLTLWDLTNISRKSNQCWWRWCMWRCFNIYFGQKIRWIGQKIRGIEKTKIAGFGNRCDSEEIIGSCAAEWNRCDSKGIIGFCATEWARMASDWVFGLGINVTSFIRAQSDGTRWRKSIKQFIGYHNRATWKSKQFELQYGNRIAFNYRFCSEPNGRG